jgi:hypothetical protein
MLPAASPIVASVETVSRFRVMCSETRGTRRFYDPYMESAEQARATGRCLCGAVTYEVHGPLRDVFLCHCVECRRWGGYLGAFSATLEEHLVIGETQALRWIDSPESDLHARRGFCAECGSSLFWDSPERDRVSIAAGTLDRPNGLRIAGHIYSHQAGDYDAIPDDGLPRDGDVRSGEVRWS